MSDTISRQAAIDVLDVLCQEHRYKIPGKIETYSQYNEAWQDALDRAEGAIFNLPSTQPEQRWIPCSERLPIISGVYIVSRWFSDGEESEILTDASYYDGDGYWYDDNRINWGRDLATDKIVAWMPLPEPYKEINYEE